MLLFYFLRLVNTWRHLRGRTSAQKKSAMGDGLRFSWHFSLPTRVYSRIRQRQAGDCVIPKTIQREGDYMHLVQWRLSPQWQRQWWWYWSWWWWFWLSLLKEYQHLVQCGPSPQAWPRARAPSSRARWRSGRRRWSARCRGARWRWGTSAVLFSRCEHCRQQALKGEDLECCTHDKKQHRENPGWRGFLGWRKVEGWRYHESWNFEGWQRRRWYPGRGPAGASHHRLIIIGEEAGSEAHLMVGAAMVNWRRMEPRGGGSLTNLQLSPWSPFILSSHPFLRSLEQSR